MKASQQYLPRAFKGPCRLSGSTLNPSTQNSSIRGGASFHRPTQDTREQRAKQGEFPSDFTRLQTTCLTPGARAFKAPYPLPRQAHPSGDPGPLSPAHFPPSLRPPRAAGEMDREQRSGLPTSAGPGHSLAIHSGAASQFPLETSCIFLRLPSPPHSCPPLKRQCHLPLFTKSPTPHSPHLQI